ncbi:MAG: ATP-binding protein, partial [Cyanobacteria bacterium]|nr:ATP-binding protein [Cyanobacteriota bacterium]
IEINVEESEVTLKADRERLTQVFVNLLLNAISCSPSGTKVNVKVVDEKSTTKIHVEDEGSGVPEALRTCLWNRFRRINDNDDGIVRGMGLPICAHLVKLHNGEISYHPAEKSGSIFTVVLPQHM